CARQGYDGYYYYAMDHW
nr:immunoglobulin heavy chain junction region [Mus musculus]MBK4186756.1 immunoglobulin heavy chain junction region [Mus musculus]